MIAGLLREHLRPGTVLVAVGNLLNGDDGFGPIVARGLAGKISLPILDAGCAPENILGSVMRLAPRKIIILDAVGCDGPVGSLHWIASDDLAPTGISTHGPSLEMFLCYVKEALAAEVYLVGAVAGHVGLGDAMSVEMRAAAAELVSLIVGAARE